MWIDMIICFLRAYWENFILSSSELTCYCEANLDTQKVVGWLWYICHRIDEWNLLVMCSFRNIYIINSLFSPWFVWLTGIVCSVYSVLFVHKIPDPCAAQIWSSNITERLRIFQPGLAAHLLEGRFELMGPWCHKTQTVLVREQEVSGTIDLSRERGCLPALTAVCSEGLSARGNLIHWAIVIK